jgi:serine/threonine protein phosphatase PrpC
MLPMVRTLVKDHFQPCNNVGIITAGDSRAVLVQRGGRVKPMSIDHKPNREDEEKRIVKLGGKIVHWGRWRVQGVLAVSRFVCSGYLLQIGVVRGSSCICDCVCVEQSVMFRCSHM